MKIKQAFFYLPVIFIAIFSSCRSLKPEKPEETYVEKTFERPVSWINIPIEVPLKEMESRLNSEIRGLIYEDTSFVDNGNDMLKYKIWKREDIKISFADDHFYFDIPLKIWVKGGFEAQSFGIDLSQFKETEMQLNLKFKSMIGMSNQWKVTTQTSPAGHTWVKKPVVKIAFFEVSLTPILDQILQNQQGAIGKELDKEIQARVELKEYVKKAWVQLQEPIELSKQFNTWLKITPTQVLITPLKVVNGQIQTNIGVKGHLDTYLGQKPAVQINTKLPGLQTIKRTQDRFQIAMTGEISHAYARQLIEENFVGQSYSFKNDRYKIRITGIDLFGSNGKLVVKLNIDGSTTGEIYLKGIPAYDSNTSSLIIKNLEYDIKTKNAIVKAADWLNHDNFIKTIEKNFRLPIGKEIEETKKLIRQNLNNNRVSENIVLNGFLENLSPGEVMITKDAIRAIVTAEGQIQLAINK